MDILVQLRKQLVGDQRYFTDIIPIIEKIIPNMFRLSFDNLKQPIENVMKKISVSNQTLS